MTDNRDNRAELGYSRYSERTTLLTALARYKALTLGVVILFVGLGMALAVVSKPEYEATAELIVEDPRSATLLSITASGQPNNIASERYLADQVQMLESNEVAQLASQALGDRMSPRFILERREIVGSATSNLIEVRFRADEAEDAKEGADALVRAYLEIRRSQARDTADVALARIDALREALDRELEDLKSRIDQVAGRDDARQELLSQIDEAVVRLNELRSLRNAAPPGSAERDALNAQIDELARDFAAWEVALRMERQNPTLELLRAQQDAAIAEQADLTALRNSMAVESELVAGGVSLVSPAQSPTDSSGLSTTMLLAGFALAGIAVAVSTAYYLSIRQRILTDSSMPEEVLDVPLLGEILDAESTDSIALPESPSAESFRFIAAGVGVRAVSLDASLILVTSPQHGSGTTGTVINTAIAAAEMGLRVAVVDADFAKQSLRKAAGLPESAGMAEVVAGDAILREVMHEIPSTDSGSISILASGSLSVGTVGFFSGAGASKLFRGLSITYDLVLIDAPPLLEVAYTSNLAGHADAVLMVVREGTSLDSVRDAGGRLHFLSTPMLGYVYAHGNLAAVGRSRRQQTQASASNGEVARRNKQDATDSEENVAV